MAFALLIVNKFYLHKISIGIFLFSQIFVMQVLSDDTTIVEKRQGRQLRVRYYKFDGKKNGLFEKFYKDGRLYQKCYYVNNKKVGVEEIWSKDGRLIESTSFNKNVKQGLSRIWSKSGKLQDSIIYNNGWEQIRYSYYTSGQLKYIIQNRNREYTEEASFFTKSGAKIGKVERGNGFFIFLDDNENLEKVIVVRDGQCINKASLIEYFQFLTFVAFQIAHAGSEAKNSTTLKDVVIRKIKLKEISFENESNISHSSVIRIKGCHASIEETVAIENFYISQIHGELGRDWKVIQTSLSCESDQYKIIDYVTIQNGKGDSFTYAFDVSTVKYR